MFSMAFATLGLDNFIRRLPKKWTWRLQALGRALGLSSIYAAWIVLFKLLVLTLLTYFLMSPNSKFQDISDAYASNEISLMGLGAVLFVALGRWLNPLNPLTFREIFSPDRFEKKFLPGFFQGSVLAGGVILAFLLSGTYRYLGFFIQFDEAPLALTNVAFRILSLIALVYCEEFIFRHKIMGYLKGHFSEMLSGLFVSILYCGAKLIQFDLGIMHLLSLFLISMSLSVRTTGERDFARGAGYWAAILIVIQPLLSLPVFGNDFAGVLLIKYQPSEILGTELHGATSRFLSGGAGGPIASFAFQLLLILDILRGVRRNRKLLWSKTEVKS